MQQVEVQVAVVFKNLQVEAAVQMAGRGSRCRFRLKLSFRICILRRQCRLLAEAAGGGSCSSCLSESAGGGGGADCWLRLQAEDRVAVVFKNLQVEAAVQMAGRGCCWSFGS